MHIFTYFGRALGMFGGCLGYVLGMLWVCFGYVLGVFRGIGFTYKNVYIKKRKTKISNIKNITTIAKITHIS